MGLAKKLFRDLPTLSVLSVLLLGPIGMMSCKQIYLKSIGADRVEAEEQQFKVDFDTAWSSILDALKSYRLDLSNRDSGNIVTRWKDNTAERNLMDGDGIIRPYIKAQFRFLVSVSRTKIKGEDVMRIKVRKEQTVLSDPMDEARLIESDYVQERTLLYRLSKIIEQKSKLHELDKIRVDRELKRAASEAVLPGESSAPQAEIPSSVPEL